jgi:hypothetical protein
MVYGITGSRVMLISLGLAGLGACGIMVMAFVLVYLVSAR